MKKTRDTTTIVLVVALLAGLGLMLYPIVSDYWNSFHQTRAIAGYEEKIDTLASEENAAMLAAAHARNEAVARVGGAYMLSAEEKAQYEDTLNVSGTGMMGFIEIPSIDVNLPIYHGTAASALQVGVGHLDWSSMPVGGPSTHTVLSGHRGLPSATLFSHLDRMVEGDLFHLHVMGELLTYEVDQIRVVEPQEMDSLRIEQGQDLATLVTCTPYGINTHRLLVRGHRVENPLASGAVHVSADAVRIDPLFVAPVLAAPVLLGLLVALLLGDKKNRKQARGDDRIAVELVS